MSKKSKNTASDAKRSESRPKRRGKFFLIVIFLLCLCAGAFYLVRNTDFLAIVRTWGKVDYAAPIPPPPPTLDYFAYNQKMIQLANYGTTTTDTGISATSSLWFSTTTSIWSPLNIWPVKTVYPNYGALLPFNRIVAYYGNFYSTAMGILGQYPPQEMLTRLEATVAQWEAADPTTPVIPALDYIAVTAQGSPGADGKYRDRMPADQIQEAISLADQVHGVVFLDVQVGWSNVETEVPLLALYLKLPNVELALDPEFAMRPGAVPGSAIGTLDATDINFAANFLAGIVKANNLPPKILVVHRFTELMVTNYQKVTPLPEVEVVLDMDGWSSPAKKIKVYHDVVQQEPIQFAGIKLFFKNDLLPPSPGLMTPAQVLQLQPQPSYVQYQ